MGPGTLASGVRQTFCVAGQATERHHLDRQEGVLGSQRRRHPGTGQWLPAAAPLSRSRWARRPTQPASEPIELTGSYTLAWRDYSTLPGPRGQFRYLATFVG